MEQIMKTDDKFFSLPKEDFDILKIEMGLLEQRIFHIENLQYKLRQFSITLWLATLGFALGITIKSSANYFLISVSCFIPILFMYMDAWFAGNTQELRSRRNEITLFLNFKNEFIKDNIKKSYDSLGYNYDELKFPLFDLTGQLTSGDDAQTRYRKHIIVKLSRTHRVVFYSFQLIGSLVVLSNFLANMNSSNLYYLLILIFPVFLIILFSMRSALGKSISSKMPNNYNKKLDNKADKISLEF
jgi:ABC-type transport system involved in multi-copper enzyme maturation permease subunit